MCGFPLWATGQEIGSGGPASMVRTQISTWQSSFHANSPQTQVTLTCALDWDGGVGGFGRIRGEAQIYRQFP